MKLHKDLLWGLRLHLKWMLQPAMLQYPLGHEVHQYLGDLVLV